MKSSNRMRMLASTFLISTAAFVAPAFAQVSSETNESATAAEQGDAIVVTGSRIARRDLTSTSPVAVVAQEEFALSGTVNVEQVINTLPQVVPGAGSFSNNPGGGVATLNLRGLGSQRNLILVNGRRYIFFDASQRVDVNTIPSFLLESVDVVTGGASAVYGSDALAGVINFRLRDDLEGMIAGGQYSITGKGDGKRYNAYVAIGTPFADDRGHVTAYAEYYKRGSIGQGDREFSRFAKADGATGLISGGSAGVPQGRIVAVGNAANPTATIGAGTNYVGGGAFFATPGTSRPYAGAADSYNYAPANFLMVPQERWTVGAYGDYEVTEGVNFYTELTFVNNRVENELAATPITQNVDVNVASVCRVISAADCSQITLISQRQNAAQAASTGGNSAFPAYTAGTGQFAALAPGFARLQINTRTVQITNRNSSDDRNAFRVLAGLKGNITDSLTYDAYYMYARTRNANIQEGNVSRSAFTRLVGNGTCNPFGLNQYSDACISGISILAQNNEISELQVATANISSPLFTTPWSSDPVAFAAGVEWRSMSGEFIPDTALQTGDVVGFNAGQSTAGSYSAKEVFGELNVPLVSDGFLHRLELNGAVRYSDYSLGNVGGVWAYAAGGRLAPIPDVEFRGQFQRAVRAPNVSELFGGTSVGFPPATDPCALPSAATNTTIRAVCEATGVPSGSVGQAFIQPNSQIQGAFGGNPNLEEEVSDTWTAGVVLRPSFIPRLNIAVDWYKIKIDQAVATAGGGVAGILNLCYNVIQNAASPVCALISRDSQGIISGPPFVVSAGNANLSSLKTEGVDIQVDYNQPLNFSLTGAGDSRLNFFFLGTYTKENSYQASVGVGDPVECAGRFGLQCGNPTPEWKWSSRLSWIDGPLTTSLRWRHVGSVKDDDDTTDFIVDKLSSYDLFDLSASWTASDNFTLNLGVNNLFNKLPTVIGSNQEQANTYPGVYDVLGRDFFVSAQFRF